MQRFPFGYDVYSVIERNGVIGIITKTVDHYFTIMFEDGRYGVNMATYPLSAVARFRVIG